ncbi:MAG: gliding motility-associated C-terminal domain-containing protein [Chitinophagaceae bacterium]
MVKYGIYFLVLLWSCLDGITQVCNGSLGDPAVHITFGTGANPGPALTPGVSSYNYSSKDCPGEGEYAIRNLTFLCYSDSWYTVPFDHTPGDGNNGYYMEINGGDNPKYYENTLSGLCPNTTYELSFWIMNLSKPAAACDGNSTEPDIKYTVETAPGNVLATAKTGPVAKKNEATWTQYNLLFKTDASTSVLLSLTNNATGGCGMDFLLDDIMVRPCGPAILAAVALSGLRSTKACEDDTSAIRLNAMTGLGFQVPVYQWQESLNSGASWADIAGATNTDYIRPASSRGTYQYRVLVGEAGNLNTPQCRLGSNTVEIIVDRIPYAQGTNYSYCLGKDVTLFAAGGEKYFWTGPNGFTSNGQSPIIPNIQFSDSGLYKVQVTTSAGCKGEHSTYVAIFSNPVAVVNTDVSMCEGSSTSLLASGGTEYFWTPAKGLSSVTTSNPGVSPADSTVYTVNVKKNGCFDTATVRVNVWKKPVANAGPDRKMKKNQSISLSASAKGTDISYFWTPSLGMNNINVLNPVITASQDVIYTLHVNSNKGCGTSTDDVQVRVYDKINIPNAFSPNGDGINDVWKIEPLDLFGDTETLVFNRYGQVVFRSRGYSKPWDGTRNGHPISAGTYYYTIDMKDGNPLLKGSLFIVR